MSLFSHGGWVWLSAGENPSPTRGQLLHFLGPSLLNHGPLSDNILLAHCFCAPPLLNNGPSQNIHGALLYNNASPLPCAVAMLPRAGSLQAGITPIQANNYALPDNTGAKSPSANTKERNDALPHERADVFPPISPMQFTPN